LAMGGPYLGRIKLRWCMSCNLPVLGVRCGKCGGKTVKVDISPPGDARPAFEGDVELINKTVEDQFGTRLLPEDKVVVLNKASGMDRFDEVIMDGRILGVLEYDVKKQGYSFLPRLEGARRIWESSESRRKVVEIDPSAVPYILKGASVLMPGVVSFDEDIEKGDQVVVVSDDGVVAVGRSMVSGEEARVMKKGMFVKVRRHGRPGPPRVLEGGQNWEDAVEANREVLEKYEEEAMSFIRKVSDCSIPKAVAFSGGKDSLATLLLVQKVLGDVPVIFVDTGVEFPETTAFVRAYREKGGFELLTGKGGDFFKGVEYFGPPGRDYRWCCKVCKLGPTAKIIERHFPGGVLNFIGQRAYESETRARSQRTWRNPWVPKQKGASPIQHWTSLHVWLYLMKEGQEANVLYGKGMERVGCWPCPASDMAEAAVIDGLYPGMWRRWIDILKSHGMGEKEIATGAWRWRMLPEGRRELGATGRGRRVYEYVEEAGRVRGEVKVDFEALRAMSRVFDGVLGDDAIEFDGIVLRDGCFEFFSRDPREREEKLKRVFGLLERTAHCFGCGVCLGQCREGAIEIAEGRARVKENCVSCGRCHSRCPIVKYGVEQADFRARRAPTKGFL